MTTPVFSSSYTPGEDIDLYVGEEWSQQIQKRAADGVTIIPLAAPLSQIRLNAKGPLVAQFNCQVQSDGSVIMSLTSDQTAVLPTGWFLYDLVASVNGQDATVIMSGNVRIRQLISHG